MPPEQDFGTMGSDILIKGNLRKAKSWKKRFFVLRDCSPAKLEYYESERKWKTNGNKPKRTISLEKPWNIDKKRSSKHEYLIVIFTEDEYFTMAADTAEVQDSWIFALQRASKQDPGCVLYKHMWYVTLDNKEFEDSKNGPSSRLHGPHLACLTHDQLILIPANSNGGPNKNCLNPVEISISTIRMCGYHKERMFFKPGRGSGIGAGILWINVHDELFAHKMNDTILSMMYAKQEEGAGYRNRSYSSGSNSSRSRSLRSHYNNPPPSIIGMRKSGFGASSKRLRCDSLPVTQFTGINDPRFRTGSEGEHTLRTARCNSNRSHNGSFRTGSEGEHTLRNSRYSNGRSHNGSVSPAMRNRLWMMRRRNSFAHHRQPHHVTPSHASSFSGSLMTSSASSSAEQINGDLLSLASGDGFPFDELSAVSLTTSIGPLSAQRNGSVSRHAKRYTGNWSSPIREGLETPQHCCSCSSMYGQSHYLDATGRFPISMEQAPPPPEVDPPPYPLDSNLNKDYANTFFHARAQSLDENSCHSTQSSFVSSSPHQCSSLGKVDCDSFSPASESVQSELAPSRDSTLSSPSKRRSPLTLQPTPVSSVNDLPSEVKSQEDNRHIHQKISSDPEPKTPRSSSFLSKITSTFSHSHDTRTDPEYTPMSPASNEAKMMSDGYVPMRSYPLQSTPQDIRGRRRSTPDVSCRNSRLSPPLNEPNSARSICSTCRGCVLDRGRKNQGSLASSKPPLCQSSNEKRNSTDSNSTDSNHLVPPIGDSSRISTPSPAEKSNQEDLDLRALQEEVNQIKKSLDESRKDHPADVAGLSTYSTAGADLSCDAIGYLPMSPINPALPLFRKNVFNSILSVAESHKAAPMYPHQRKDRTFVSQDKPSKSLRSRRPKSLSFCRSGSFSRKSQKNKKIPVSDAPSASRVSPPPNGSRSPGGDYVNIDYKKAREQMSSGYSLNLIPSDGLSKTVGSGTDINSNDAEYTAMNFNGI